ncbi:hypothetical protein EG329_002112 [Mollisiaceae sp. DMI_Dod_QoI]|nr:hypothetical protein EG329_002112 [Helotiales sp. DMI_Dod_QoI]
MRCFQILSIFLGLVFLSNALPRALPYRSTTISRRHTASKHAVTTADALELKDFLISGFFAISTVDAPNTSWNRSLSFVFADPNSNTSTICSQNWTDTANSTTAPMGPGYVVCDATNSTQQEFFDWHFSTYTDLSDFSIEFAHEFSDPNDYPPPYNYVEYFATTNVSLICEDAVGLSGCTLPASESPLQAHITSISN